MINNVLYATVLEAQAPRIERHDVAPQEFLDQLRSDYEPRVQSAEVAVIWSCPAAMPVLKTDGSKLRLVIQNLINNAVKFTKKGSVTISARAVDPGAVEFEVADTGVGIPEAHLPFIFEKFRQADSSQTRSFGGVGMGLYIAKKFTEMLGGTIAVESRERGGTTLRVTIPIDHETSIASPGKME
jgi:signal transduction histidine kinase